LGTPVSGRVAEMNGIILAMGPQIGSGRKFERTMLAFRRRISIEPANDYAATDATAAQKL